jgi:hypothetical protein
MSGMKNWMLGAAMVAGVVGLSAAPAQAARVGIYIGAPAAYIPPCPGPGYAWVAGYWSNGYWVPGYWNFVSRPYGPGFRGDAGWDHRHDFDRHDFDRRDFDRRDEGRHGFYGRPVGPEPFRSR